MVYRCKDWYKIKATGDYKIVKEFTATGRALDMGVDISTMKIVDNEIWIPKEKYLRGEIVIKEYLNMFI